MAALETPISSEQRKREDELVRAHLALVTYAVNEVVTRVPRHVARTDLISAGMEGLAQAARSFDPERGIAFHRYASTRIKGALLDELRRRDWASRSVRSKARKVAAVSDQLTASLGRTPTTAEIAEAAHMELASVTAISEDVDRAVVLNFDAILTHGDSDNILPPDLDSPDAVLLDREREAYLLDAVSALPERLRRVVVGYFFDERPMQELADELGVTESRISQMRAEALVLLKEGINSQLDPDELPVSARTSRRVARRKAAYYAAIAGQSDYRSRLTSRAPRLAPAGPLRAAHSA